MRAIPVFYTSEMVVQNDGAGFSPSARKPQYVVESWNRRGYPIVMRTPTALTVLQMSIAHDLQFVRGVLAGERTNGFGNRNMDIARTFPLTSGAMLDACEKAFANGQVACAPTSGFHHAGYSNGSGFCTFNGLMIAALTMNERHGICVGILDYDAHYGNGTDEIVRALGIRTTMHFTFGEHITRYGGEALVQHIPNVIEEMVNGGCELIIYQAGADPHESDPLGGYLTSEQMERRDRLVFETCKRLGVPVAWNLAGGYQRVEGAATFEDSIRPVLDIHDTTMRVCCEVYTREEAALTLNDALPLDPSLNEVLASKGITHRRTGRGYEHEYLRDGKVVFTGTVSQGWDWVKGL